MFAFAVLSASSLILPHEEKSFLAHMRTHGLLFIGSEYHMRLGIYLANDRYVRAHNSGHSSFTLSLNRLATLTPGEYHQLLGTRGGRSSGGIAFTSPAHARGDYDPLDYRDEGVIQGVKDQGTCGASWAFAAISAEEAMFALSGQSLLNLSEQNLIDCVTTAAGCNGGCAIVAEKDCGGIMEIH
jgi:cathepsin L